MRNNIIVILEGMPGTGKSSLIDFISKNYSQEVIVFPQVYFEKNVIKNRNPDEVYVEEEIRKSKSIKRINRKIVFIDRGVYSHLAYAHAKSVIESNEDKEFNVIEKLFKNRFSKYIYLPNYVFFLDVKEKISIERRIAGKSLEFNEWYDEEFLNQIRKSYGYIFAKNKIEPITINTSGLSKEDLYFYFILFINSVRNKLTNPRKREPKLSIVICTRNREKLLNGTLKSLIKQIIFQDLIEIIVIDNASSDGTKSQVLRFAKKNEHIDIRYIYEENIGLSLARNRGINEAKGEIIAFIDDDAIADKRWSLEILKSFNDNKIAVVGGKVTLKYLSRKPVWVTRDLEIYLSKLSIPGQKIINPPDYLLGTNIAFRLTALKTAGGFSESFGRKDKILRSLEEIELLRRIKGIVLYNPRIKVSHKVSASRLTLRYFLVRVFWQGVSEARLDFVYGRPKLLDQNFSTRILLKRWVLLLYKPKLSDLIKMIYETLKVTSYIFEYNRSRILSAVNQSFFNVRSKRK